MNQPDDQQIIFAVLGGDVNAYSTLVERYQRPIYNLMYRMTHSYSDAMDLAQETFIKAFQQLHRFHVEKRFFPWLYTIGLNHSKNFLRQSKVSRTISVEDYDAFSGLEYPGQEEEHLCARLDLHKLREALDQLPVDYREALILRYHESLTFEEIAMGLELSLSGAKMRVHRGLKMLREILEADDHEKENFA
jgi:RNA polymerase sigma-70 factor, ECF subfamily